jgi:5'-3' exonuclease
MAQCVTGTRVVCWDRLRNTWLDEAGVLTKFGIRPESIPDYLALVGDTADGIPGVPRWGAKSASSVLAQYVHLEHIPSDARAWSVKVRGADALSKSLEERREASLLYRQLATLRCDVPLAESLSDLAWRGPDEAELTRLCGELGEPAPALLERLRVQTSAPA